MKTSHLAATVLLLSFLVVIQLLQLPQRVPLETPLTVAVSPPTRRAIIDATAPNLPSTKGCQRWALNSSVSKDIKSVEWCPTGTCGGTLTILLSPSGWSTTRRISTNAALSETLQRRFGPNLFRFRLEGPETRLVSMHPEERLAYRAVVPSSMSPGDYRVQLEWLYKDFAAVDETINQWPPLLKQPILELDPAFSTNYHLQQVTLPSTVSITCGETPDLGDSVRPLCTGNEPAHEGKWQIRQPGTVFTRVRVRKIKRDPIVFQWAMQPDRDWKWVRDHCESRRTSAEKMLLALKGRRIAIGGDSQLRALYYGVVNTLLGMELKCVRNITSLTVEPKDCVQNVKGSQRRDIMGLQIDYVDDLFLDKFMGGRYASYDIVVVGFGQHPASKEHWSYDRYRGSVVTKAAQIQKLRDNGKKVVWYGAPQYPHTTNGYPVFVKDWRTDARLTLFNEIAYSVIRELRVPIVDSFAATAVMSHTSPDQAHYSNFVCAELVYILFDALCALDGVDC